MRNLGRNIIGGRAVLIALVVSVLSACKTDPQPVKHLGMDDVDAQAMAQMLFNKEMTNAADKECLHYVEKDSLKYALDDFGVWYTKTQQTEGDSLQKGQMVTLQMSVYELNDTLVADMKEQMQVGSNDLPLAIYRSLQMMRAGEQMVVVAPWYAAYGVEGTSLIKPYTNLKFVITAE
jgi:FKBP-type peptidyl-prolyl cis-trans isomerase